MHEEIEATITSVSQKSTFWGAVVSILGSLSADWVFGAIGAIVAVISALTARYYLKRRDIREEKAFEANQHRKDELLAAQLEFFKRAPQTTADATLDEAKVLGIDTTDFPASDNGKL